MNVRNAAEANVYRRCKNGANHLNWPLPGGVNIEVIRQSAHFVHDDQGIRKRSLFKMVNVH
jgi:hypothetical protein